MFTIGVCVADVIVVHVVGVELSQLVDCCHGVFVSLMDVCRRGYDRCVCSCCLGGGSCDVCFHVCLGGGGDVGVVDWCVECVVHCAVGVICVDDWGGGYHRCWYWLMTCD